jgi:hypothetical protein
MQRFLCGHKSFSLNVFNGRSLFFKRNFSQPVNIKGEVNPTWDFLEKNTNNSTFRFTTAFIYIIRIPIYNLYKDLSLGEIET